MKNVLAGLAVGLSLLVGVSASVEAATVTLYNGSSTSSPASQGQLVFGALSSSGQPLSSPFSPTPGFESAGAGGRTLNTAANGAEYAGYTNYLPGTGILGSYVLDRTLGYSISFNVALNSTTNGSNNRAAFSIIAISSDGLGIELGFENGLIFGQSADFIRTENAAFTTTSPSTYTLSVLNSGYTLSNGSQTLSGDLRNYNFNPATSSPPLGTFNPYQIGNFLFFGDNTGQESGIFTLGAASATANEPTAVPYDFHPTTGIVILGAWATFRHFKNKKK